MLASPEPLVIQQGASVKLGDLAGLIDNRERHTTPKLLMTRRPQNTQTLQPTPHIIIPTA
jgi:hypothetical protein